MRRIFVSYHHETIRDREARILNVIAALKAEGFEVFSDHRIRNGESWRDRIAAEIDASDIGLVLWSEDAHASIFVRSEADRISKLSKLRQAWIADKTAPITLPMPYEQYQYADLRDWSGDRSDVRWLSLRDGLLELDSALAVSKRQQTIRGAAHLEDISGDAVFRDADNFPLMLAVTTPAAAKVGSDDDDDDAEFNEHPAFIAQLETPFALAVYPVSFSEWNLAAANGATGVDHVDAPPEDAGKPVVGVTWDQANSYVAWLNHKCGEIVYHLPSEVQWEVAARLCSSPDVPATNRSPADFGDRHLARNLMGMIGEVWQWTDDVYLNSLADMPLDGAPRRSPHSEYRTVRGPSWRTSDFDRRVSARVGYHKSHTSDDIGFRVMRRL